MSHLYLYFMIKYEEKFSSKKQNKKQTLWINSYWCALLPYWELDVVPPIIDHWHPMHLLRRNNEFYCWNSENIPHDSVHFSFHISMHWRFSDPLVEHRCIIFDQLHVHRQFLVVLRNFQLPQNHFHWTKKC